MEDLEKKARRIARKAEEAARELARPRPLLSEYFGEAGRIEIFGRGEDGERFIAELGPPTRITAQTLPRQRNPNREVLWETRTWDNWAVQLVHYQDSRKVYLFLSHGPHYTARLMDNGDLKALRAATEKARRRILSSKEKCNVLLPEEDAESEDSTSKKKAETKKEA